MWRQLIDRWWCSGAYCRYLSLVACMATYFPRPSINDLEANAALNLSFILWCN